MNRILLYILIIGTLYGCSSDNVPTPMIPEEEVSDMGSIVSFSSNISYETNVESRAGILEGSSLPQGSKIGIYALKTSWTNVNGEKLVQPVSWNETNFQYDFKNEPYVTEGNSGHFTSLNGSIGRFPTYDNAALKFYAYYPYTPEDIVFTSNGVNPSAPKLKVEIKDKADLTEDYLYTGKIDAYPTGDRTTINLSFKHALTRLQFNMYTKVINYTQTDCALLTKIVLKTNYNQSGYMNIETGEIESVEGNNTELEYKLTEPYKIYNGRIDTKTGIEFLLIPSDNAIKEIIVYVQTNENEEAQPYTAYTQRKDGAKQLKAGAVYTVNVNYRTRANFECDITGWLDNTSSNGNFNIGEENNTENDNFVRVE